MRRAAVLVDSLTLLNAALGLSAMVLLALGRSLGLPGPETLYVAALLVTWAYVPDILDGLLARRFGVASKVGSHLDVGADTTTFNLATALLVAVAPVDAVDGDLHAAGSAVPLGIAAALVYASCGLMRSARFVATPPPPAAVGRYFYGMTTNGAAFATTALVMTAHALGSTAARTAILTWVVPAQAILLGPLMLSRICFPDVPQHLMKGLAPRWPAVALAASAFYWGPAIAWTLAVYLYAYVLPIVRALRRKPLL